jgi:hypothetical protein
MTAAHRAAPRRSPHATPRTTRRAARLAAFLGVPAALIASGIFISNASYAAFSATTQNPTSNWTTGTVGLTDDDANTALFTATGLKPGSTGSNCITVTSTGSLPASVKVYATNVAGSSALAAAITLTIDQGTGTCAAFTPDANGALYSGLLSSFGTTRTSFTTGVGAWTPTGAATDSRLYRISYTLSSSATVSVQGMNTQLGLTWESQNS